MDLNSINVGLMKINHACMPLLVTFSNTISHGRMAAMTFASGCISSRGQYWRTSGKCTSWRVGEWMRHITEIMLGWWRRARLCDQASLSLTLGSSRKKSQSTPRSWGWLTELILPMKILIPKRLASLSLSQVSRKVGPPLVFHSVRMSKLLRAWCQSNIVLRT